MAERYDIIIIGSGPGGYTAAVRAAQVGLKAAIVEKDPFYGGTCTWVGCIPTKALLENAAVYDQTRHAKDFGIATGEVTLNFGAVMDRKTKIVRKMGKAVENLIKANKVDAYQGHGRLAGPGKVSITGADGKVTTLETKNVILATGSVPRMLPGLTADGVRVVTSDEILSLKEIPKHLIVLGAGAVGVEFASIFLRFGSKVTLVEMLPRVVPIEDEDISAELAKSLRKQGVTIHTGMRAGNIRVTATGVALDISPVEPAGSSGAGGEPGRARPPASRATSSWWPWAAGRSATTSAWPAPA